MVNKSSVFQLSRFNYTFNIKQDHKNFGSIQRRIALLILQNLLEQQ